MLLVPSMVVVPAVWVRSPLSVPLRSRAPLPERSRSPASVPATSTVPAVAARVSKPRVAPAATVTSPLLVSVAPLPSIAAPVFTVSVPALVTSPTVNVVLSATTSAPSLVTSAVASASPTVMSLPMVSVLPEVTVRLELWSLSSVTSVATVRLAVSKTTVPRVAKPVPKVISSEAMVSTPPPALIAPLLVQAPPAWVRVKLPSALLVMSPVWVIAPVMVTLAPRSVVPVRVRSPVTSAFRWSVAAAAISISAVVAASMVRDPPSMSNPPETALVPSTVVEPAVWLTVPVTSPARVSVPLLLRV
ncbi:hypothetical protein TRM7557_00246 [Tritonibacter multivorans]|uniref:Uncharacterized protein n=1 Tax=Tritonibacter multivorans TaxID=928856 RepID=A0A0P1GHQ3_9RHOB|nr:hypothetical protein TRM7557_00244 [Tritonibacter multivorans]CUH75156.1 hypothetical protein TRM7557_00246 [Tritonibacter multivorans]